MFIILNTFALEFVSIILEEHIKLSEDISAPTLSRGDLYVQGQTDAYDLFMTAVPINAMASLTKKYDSPKAKPWVVINGLTAGEANNPGSQLITSPL